MSQHIANEDLQYLIKIAQAAAYDAGSHLMSKQNMAQVLYKKAPRDDLLDADLEAEEILLNKLRTDFPDFSILSEETAQDNKHAPFQWVIDPLDGSANFQHGNPMFAVSIGLLSNNRAILGAIYLPLYNEMFTAIQGYGAMLNGHTIVVSNTSEIEDAVIHIGDFAKSGNSRDNIVRIVNMERLAHRVSRIRMIGSAAADLAYIACGRADGLVMYSNHPWDIEAGRLILSEAGGSARTLLGQTNEPIFIYSNGYIHQLIVQSLSIHHGTELTNIPLRKEDQ